MVQLLAIKQDKYKLPILVLIHTTVSIRKVRSEASTCGLLNFLLNLPDRYRSDFIFFWGGGEGQGGRSESTGFQGEGIILILK